MEGEKPQNVEYIAIIITNSGYKNMPIPQAKTNGEAII